MLRSHIPAELAIDTFDGRAWIGIVPFSMRGVRLRWTPPLPRLSAFPELNVRTYVTAQAKAGVWFFSLDAASAFGVAAARFSFHLPYFRARMQSTAMNGWVHYQSKRTHSEEAPPAVFQARYQTAGESFEAQRGTLEHFLTERYCLYSVNAKRIYRGEIHHPPWQLQQAQAQLTQNSMAEAAGLVLPAAPPLLHFSQRQDMVAWAPYRIV